MHVAVSGLGRCLPGSARRSCGFRVPLCVLVVSRPDCRSIQRLFFCPEPVFFRGRGQPHSCRKCTGACDDAAVVFATVETFSESCWIGITTGFCFALYCYTFCCAVALQYQGRDLDSLCGGDGGIGMMEGTPLWDRTLRPSQKPELSKSDHALPLASSRPPCSIHSPQFTLTILDEPGILPLDGIAKFH